MSIEIESAFPHATQQYAHGLTKLETFTKAAMQGFCANGHDHVVQLSYGSIAQRSFDTAKATLALLEQERGK